jgi:hypothetical protein
MADYESVAKQVGTTPNALERRVGLVLSENEIAWGTMEDTDKQNRAVRIAARQLMSEKRKIESSGCQLLRGCFIASPPYKDWAKMAYKKMNAQMVDLGEDGLQSLIDMGTLVTFTPSEDGYVRRANTSLMAKKDFEVGVSDTTVDSLPKGTVEHEALGIHYYIVADKTLPKFPSGDANYRYGAPRPTSEPERTCLFLGQLDTYDDEPRIYEIKFVGNDALEQQPTFLPGVIPVKAGKDNAKTGNGRAWTRKGVSIFSEDEDSASLLPSAPFDSNGEGFMREYLSAILDEFNDMTAYYNEHRDDEDWWSQSVGLLGEVSHIDTLDNGASTIVVGDLDDFTAPSIEVRVPKSQQHLLNFAVGSTIFITGAVWLTNDGEPRMSIHGWYIVDGIAPPTVDVEGWDA